MTNFEKSFERGVGSLEDSGEDEVRFETSHRLESRLSVGDRERIPRKHRQQSDRSHRQHKVSSDLGSDSPLLRSLAIISLLLLSLIWLATSMN